MEFQTLFQYAMKREVPHIEGWISGIETVLNLGAGKQAIPGAIPYGLEMGWNADTMPIPHGDESVDHVIMFHFLEHLRQPIKLLREVERVLRPGGIATICVPYYASQMQAQDLTHCHAFCETTWANLFANPYYDRSGAVPWHFAIELNLIAGVAERNLCLLTQLRKTS